MNILYIILFISAIAYAFTQVSRGWLFANDGISGVIILLHYLILVVLIIFGITNDSWLQIIYMFISDILSVSIFKRLWNWLLFSRRGL